MDTAMWMGYIGHVGRMCQSHRAKGKPKPKHDSGKGQAEPEETVIKPSQRKSSSDVPAAPLTDQVASESDIVGDFRESCRLSPHSHPRYKTDSLYLAEL